jgi:hypothetical protein
MKPFAEVKPIKRCKQIKQENDAIKSTKQVQPKKSGYQAPVISSPHYTTYLNKPAAGV